MSPNDACEQALSRSRGVRGRSRARGGSVRPSHAVALAAAAGMACLWLGACSSQQLYATGQQWQRNQCLKIADTVERQRCDQSLATSYESYKVQVDSLKKP